MCPSFFALFSKAGIACAADTDHTVYRLSKDLPVALAVNPLSPIPWEKIIEEYKRNLEPKPHKSLAEYAADFDTFLSTHTVEKAPKTLSLHDANIIFFGFGSDDIYPSAFDVNVIIKENDTLGLADSYVHRISDRGSSFFHLLGDFDSVSTLLFGATDRTRTFFYNKHVAIWEEFARRITERFKGSEYEQYVKNHLEHYDFQEDIRAKIDQATFDVMDELSLGFSSFGIEDMVAAVETIVNANTKLNHLRSGASGKSGDAREIAVMTIPEGLSWIKHSLYHRRNEI
jgi:hypothetical protein